MSNINKQALREMAERAASDSWGYDRDEFNDAITPEVVLALLDELEAKDIRIGKLEVIATDYGMKFQRAQDALKHQSLLHKTQMEAAERRIAELEAWEKSLRTVGVMSQKAFQRLEGSESRFIALWPRPEIYLPRKRPDDGVIVYARVAGAGKGEAS